MNKIVVLLLSFVLTIPLWGQQQMRVPRFFDNWSITAMGGIYHPLAYSPNGELVSAGYGVELKKQFSPVWGLAAEYNHFVKNSRLTAYGLDRPQIHLLSTFNLMNLFSGYRGQSRAFEIDMKWGLGAGTYTGTLSGSTLKGDYLVSKIGADFNFNLGRNRAWTLTLRPALVFDLHSKDGGRVAYNANQADIQLMAGLTYHFRNHDDRRNFSFGDPVMLEPTAKEGKTMTIAPIVKPAVPTDKTVATVVKSSNTSTAVDTIVIEVKLALRSNSTGPDTVLVSPVAKTQTPVAKIPIVETQTPVAKIPIVETQTPVAKTPIAQTQTPVEETPVVETPIPESADTLQPHQRSWQMTIAFEEKSARVDEGQFSNVEQIAYILQHRPNARVFVQGYATKEEQNGRREDLSWQRARIIKTLLVAQYGISGDRVVVYGRGSNREFSVSEWPSVAICSVTDPD